ncbi:helix-turn-helix domain-containing protein [Desertivirga arenae]
MKLKTISQICYIVGFTTPSYFTRAFKTKYGITPSDFIAKRG